jgi:hypothetical protein
VSTAAVYWTRRSRTRVVWDLIVRVVWDPTTKVVLDLTLFRVVEVFIGTSLKAPPALEAPATMFIRLYSLFHIPAFKYLTEVDPRIFSFVRNRTRELEGRTSGFITANENSRTP